jgi:hypothetical protein
VIGCCPVVSHAIAAAALFTASDAANNSGHISGAFGWSIAAQNGTVVVGAVQRYSAGGSARTGQA